MGSLGTLHRYRGGPCMERNCHCYCCCFHIAVVVIKLDQKLSAHPEKILFFAIIFIECFICKIPPEKVLISIYSYLVFR